LLAFPEAVERLGCLAELCQHPGERGTAPRSRKKTLPFSSEGGASCAEVLSALGSIAGSANQKTSDDGSQGGSHGPTHDSSCLCVRKAAC
jgi:hypothetical protein